MLKNLSSLFCGILFGLGLVIAQMINPQKVLAFLDITGHWDPSLALVMVSALITFGFAYRLIIRRPEPLLEPRFHLPDAVNIDARLLTGAALFGIGWGLSGYCPGAVIAAMGYGSMEALLFTFAMCCGMGLFCFSHRRKSGAGRVCNPDRNV